MGIFKVFIISAFLFSFGCKNEPKKQASVTKVPTTLKNDSVQPPVYPKYLNKNYVLGRFDYTKDSNFVKVSKKLSSKEIYIRKEVLQAFQELYNSAKKDGISFKIISGTRNFAHQKRIWDYKWNNKYKSTPKNKRALKILEYSSMPSTSRHHWGTDIDINNLENVYFSSGQGKKEYDWLIKNAHNFGFYQVYTSKKNGRTGYNEEKWHWSYAPLSSVYLDFYNKHITHQDINGFKGYEFASKIDMIKNYVNGINPEILNHKN